VDASTLLIPMRKFYQTRGRLIVLSATIAGLSVACRGVDSVQPTREPVKPISATPAQPVEANFKPAPTPSPLSQSTAYERAIDVAESAASISQSAQSSEDWKLVVSQWQQSIELLKGVPSSHANYAIAKTKIIEYQGYLKSAQQQVIRPSRRSPAIASTTVIQPATTASVKPATKLGETDLQVFSVPIKRRVGRTPVIDVTFNDKYTFEMILDTGASTTVVTPAMAEKMGLKAHSEVMADTASAKQVKFQVAKADSIAVDGAIAKNLPVAIASSVLDTGLLGQDFFGNYDIAIKSDVVEFHVR
jgi:predicted aspartyl protease